MLLVVAILLFTKTIGTTIVKKHLISESFRDMHEEVLQITSEYERSLTDFSYTTKSFTEQLQSVYRFLNLEVWIVNSDGNILCTASGDTTVVDKNIHKYDSEFLYETTYTKKNIKNLYDTKSNIVISPVISNENTVGYVVLLSPFSNITKKTNHLISVFFVYLLFFLVFVFLILIYIAKITIHPTSILTNAAKEFASGNFHYTFTLPENNDYKDLEAALKLMVAEIQTAEKYQQKFISNISHDFRSPLTSIGGYATAIKDGTIPYEMQEKYIDIILFETERLKKLTSNLLELSQLETGNLLLDKADFDIIESIEQLASTFEHKCNKKHLQIRLSFPTDSLIVNADKSRIEQVIYNLLDNAIKFSKNEGFIDIKVEIRGEKLFVSVKDYGKGIEKKDQSHVWNRFYKSDASRGKDKKGTGLGLSIAKEIISAHGQNIHVISTVGVGTEFIFSLDYHTSLR